MRFSKTTGTFYPEDIQYSSLPDDLIAVTVDEFSAAMARPDNKILDVRSGKLAIVDAPPPSAAQLWSAYKSQAQSLLDKSDTTIIRCAESGVAVPPDWVTYRKALRVIISANTGDPSKPLPARPAYPAGT